MPGADTEVVDLLVELVGIDSVNPGLVPGAAGEERIVAHLSARLERSGFEVTIVPAADRDGRPSLVATPASGPDGPTIVLNGHLDTVGVEGMADPFAALIDGDRLHGRGAADMKAGIAGMVVAAERLIAAGEPLRPVLALVADEEDASLGSTAVIAALRELGVRPDACLIAEPTDLALARSLRGFAVVEVTFTGRAAHSSQPERGVNAVAHLGHLLRAIDERAPSVRASGGDLMVTVADGGSSPFVVPDRARCLVEMRTVPGGADALEEVRALLQPEWQAEAELVMSRDPWRLDEAGPSADLAKRLCVELGTDTAFHAPYWMEAPLWQALCPTLVCGPSGGGVHAVDEWVDLRQVRAFADGLLSVLAEWATRGD